MYDKQLFLHSRHEENFLSLLCLDHTHPSDRERQALFFLLSGNPDLYNARRQIYDFKNHRLQIDNGHLDLSSGTNTLLLLGRNLYNGYHADGDTSPMRIFWNLDYDNRLLAFHAIKIRFFIT